MDLEQKNTDTYSIDTKDDDHILIDTTIVHDFPNNCTDSEKYNP